MVMTDPPPGAATDASPTTTPAGEPAPIGPTRGGDAAAALGRSRMPPPTPAAAMRGWASLDATGRHPADPPAPIGRSAVSTRPPDAPLPLATTDADATTKISLVPPSPLEAMVNEAVSSIAAAPSTPLSGRPSSSPSRPPLSYMPERMLEADKIAARLPALPLFTDLPPERGVCALVDGHQIAIFHTYDGLLYALSNHDPFSDAYVLARGIVGSRAGVPTVASPMYKQVFDLTTGCCLDDPAVAVPTYGVRVTGTRVEVARA